MRTRTLSRLLLAAIAPALTLALACGHRGETSAPPPEPAKSAPPPAPEPAPDTREPATWAGSVALPGSSLRLIVHLEPAEGEGWSGTIDIPAQGVKGHPLRDIEVADKGLDFVYAPPGAPEGRWAIFSIEHEAGASEGAGMLEQGGASFPLTLRRLAPGEDAGPARPQTPKEPFPYAAREIEVQSGELRLACTMVIPEGEGPFAAAALLSGSGAQDRDEAIFDHRPFAVLADHLARAQIASLRCDDRGVGGSSGKYLDTSEDELAADALAMIDALSGDARVRPAAIGVIGHSEGGIIGPLAALKEPKKVAFVVMLAGPGLPGATVLGEQLRDIAAAGGAEAAAIDANAAAQQALIKSIRAGKGREVIAEEMSALVRLQTADKALDDAAITALVDRQVDMMTSPWFRSFLESDPAKVLRKLKRPPVLALVGERDLQVRASTNLPAIARALKAAGNRDVTTRALPGLNHMFQPASSGQVEEYQDIETTIDPTVLELVAAWIAERFGQAG